MDSKKIRVAMGTVYPYDETHVRGGVEAVALSLTQALAQRDDIELHVVSCNSTIKRSCTEIRGPITFHWIATGKRLRLLRSVTMDTLRVRRAYKRIRPDIIHAQGYSEYAIAVPRHVDLILTIHGVEIFVPSMMQTAHFRGLAGLYRRKLSGWIASRSVRNSKAVISIAGTYITQVMDALLGGKTISNIENPVGRAFFDLPLSVQETEGQGPVVFYAGLIAERKDVVSLVRAFGQVADAVPGVELRIAGAVLDHKYYARVCDEVKALGLQKQVHFLGPLDEPTLLRQYVEATLFVLSSLQETAPMVIAQAMAAARPVVATRVGGIAGMIENGTTGYLVDAGDTTALADRIVGLLGDREMQLCMGRQARRIAQQRFAAASVAERTVSAYMQTLHAREVR
jgi:glycosyltransferase involved in cell wall biosynthesis